jgi:hypothetical protein
LILAQGQVGNGNTKSLPLTCLNGQSQQFQLTCYQDHY